MDTIIYKPTITVTVEKDWYFKNRENIDIPSEFIGIVTKIVNWMNDNISKNQSDYAKAAEDFFTDYFKQLSSQGIIGNGTFFYNYDEKSLQILTTPSTRPAKFSYIFTFKYKIKRERAS